MTPRKSKQPAETNSESLPTKEKSKPSKKPRVVSKQESLTNLSAIMAQIPSSDTTLKRLTKIVSDRIEAMKKAG